MKKSREIPARMICETPAVLAELGMDVEFGRITAERFPAVRLTERTKSAICAAVCDIRAFPAPEDKAVLAEILRLVIAEEDAERTADRLIGEFGSLLGVLCAAQKSTRLLGIGTGESTRVELLSSIYLNKTRRIKVVNREQAELYLGTLFGLGEEQTAALCLDENFVTVYAQVFAQIFPEPSSLKSLVKDEVKYLLFARKTNSVNDEYFNLAATVNAAKPPVRIADYILFTPQGNAHLITNERGERIFELSSANE